jgi:hypothetical protein
MLSTFVISYPPVLFCQHSSFPFDATRMQLSRVFHLFQLLHPLDLKSTYATVYVFAASAMICYWSFLFLLVVILLGASAERRISGAKASGNEWLAKLLPSRQIKTAEVSIRICSKPLAMLFLQSGWVLCTSC